MKNVKTKKHPQRLKPLSALLGAAPLIAGLTCHAEEEKPFVTGTLALMADSHFISYGADVWGGGNDWEDFLFHPMLELNFDLGKGFTGIMGIWADVGNVAPSGYPSIGKAVQEVDVWLGVGYKYEEWSFTLLYQEWMYNEQAERIVDFKVGYSHFLNPTVTLHSRVDNEMGPGFDNGAAVVVGVAPGKSWDALSLSFPVNVAAETDGFHAGDSGFSFASAGVGASVPLKFIPRGTWSFEAGLTYYFTNEDVIPGNVEENFITGTAGIKLVF